MFKVYLSGPMRGKKDHNYPAFFKAAELLRGMGMAVANPAEINPADPKRKYGKSKIRWFMWNDLHELMWNCTMVLCFGNWRKSSGATAEVAVALSIGMPVYEISIIKGKIEWWSRISKL